MMSALNFGSENDFLHSISQKFTTIFLKIQKVREAWLRGGMVKFSQIKIQKPRGDGYKGGMVSSNTSDELRRYLQLKKKNHDWYSPLSGDFMCACKHP